MIACAPEFPDESSENRKKRPTGGRPSKRPRGLFLGWSAPQKKNIIGFPQFAPEIPQPAPITYDGDGHLLITAPTGGGKGRCSLIPNLLTYPGSTLTIDVKGEAYAVTARARRAMGHRVVVLDPFLAAAIDSDGLNPLDLFALPGAAPDVDSEMLAELLTGGLPLTGNDRFWETNGKGLLTGLIGLTAEHPDPQKRNFGQVLDYMYADDTDYGLAVQLDTHKFSNQLARQEIVAYLQHESEKCRPSVRSTAQCPLKSLGAESVRKCLARTTFDLMDWYHGGPIDIFLVFPPDKLDSHKQLLRLLLGTLMTILMRRTEMPESRTLLLLDEVAQLGSLPQLKTALTLLRGFGVQCISYWQDISQIKSLYPLDWEAILNNSAVLQAFGMTNNWSAKTIADVLDLNASELLKMGLTKQALLLPGKAAQITRRTDYLTDAHYRGLFDANPRYKRRKDRGL